MIEVREAKRHDFARIVRIGAEAYGQPWTFRDVRRHFEDLGRIYVVNDGRRFSRLVGFAAIVEESDTVEVTGLAVIPAFQRQGHGSRLIQHVLMYAHVCRYESVRLVLRDDQFAAQVFLKSNEFRCFRVDDGSDCEWYYFQHLLQRNRHARNSPPASRIRREVTE